LNIPLFDIGNAAAKSLMDLLAGNEIPQNQLLQCNLIERDSVAEAPELFFEERE
jgi:DNA-binding LacI/PurR family transcriptional regulator